MALPIDVEWIVAAAVSIAGLVGGMAKGRSEIRKGNGLSYQRSKWMSEETKREMKKAMPRDLCTVMHGSLLDKVQNLREDVKSIDDKLIRVLEKL